MDLTHLHLMLNHLPVFGVMIGFLILAWGMLRGFEEVKKIGLVVLVLTAVVAVPVYLTGEPAEETVEHLPGVTEQIIEAHEDSALLSLIPAIATGFLALAGLFLNRFSSTGVARAAMFTILLLSFVTGGLMARTANLGGQIRHTEIRQAAQNNNPASETKKVEKNETDEDDH
jgi:uncharacterized membrane protein